MAKHQGLILAWLPDGVLPGFITEFPQIEFVDARDQTAFEEHFSTATLTYGMPPVARLPEAASLRWIQLISAGVPQDLCPVAQRQGIQVTNLAGLYGASIAEHAL